MVSRCERGGVTGVTLPGVECITAALGASVHLQVRWRGEQLERLIDAAHASLQEATATLLGNGGWLVRPEASFNLYGDRGRVEILAFHPRANAALVVEVKSAIGDLQETIGRLDVKARIGLRLARTQGWTGAKHVVPCLVIADRRAARRIVDAHAALFRRYDLRGRAAGAWTRRPTHPAPAGLLWFADGQDSRGATITRANRAPKGPDSRPV